MSSITRRLRTPLIACAALVWMLAVAAPAGAEVGVGFTPERDLGEDGIAESQLAIEADSADPEDDNVTVTVTEESVTVSEPGGVIGGGEGCTQSNATSITCPMPFLVGIRTYGGNDTVTVSRTLPAFVEAGTGADTVTVGFGRVFGEEGADTLATNGEPLAEQVFDGQNPDNWDDYGALADGYSGIEGGPGDDELTSGDEGEVLVGEQGEDTIDGGAGRDIITGNAGSDTLRGGDDDDQLEGDFPVGDAAVVFASDTIEGGPGATRWPGRGERPRSGSTWRTTRRPTARPGRTITSAGWRSPTPAPARTPSPARTPTRRSTQAAARTPSRAATAWTRSATRTCGAPWRST